MADDADAADGELEESTVKPQSGVAEVAATEEAAAPAEAADPEPVAAELPRGSGVRLALVIGLVAVMALGGLVGWLGYRAYQSHQAQQQRNLFVQVGRQVAVDLTTISYTEAEADVQRIMDSATGPFYDDFQRRSAAFVAVVKQAQSKSEGTVTEAGLESDNENEGRVLVAVTVRTSNAGAAEQQPRAWRMRIILQKVGDGAKVSNVEFVQ